MCISINKTSLKIHNEKRGDAKNKENVLFIRNKLLKATEHPFHEQGIFQIILQDIAQRTATARGAVCQHFKKKADFFNAMMDHVP